MRWMKLLVLAVVYAFLMGMTETAAEETGITDEAEISESSASQPEVTEDTEEPVEEPEDPEPENPEPGTEKETDPQETILNGWYEEDGSSYWYEEGIRLGTADDENCVSGLGSVRGREIYDPESDAWYWLDAEKDGAKAVDKEVWMPYLYRDEPAGSTDGKWVRYDAEGKMVKGQFCSETGNWYYYQSETGAMAKGMNIALDGEYLGCFDEVTGTALADLSWIDEFWYEKGIRQGYLLKDPAFRGREIYDPESDAWYWLDAVQQGARAVNKEVYLPYVFQKEKPGSTNGKWVRYDREGHLQHGWYKNHVGTYFFDYVTGAMFKGVHTINDRPYCFSEITGCLQTAMVEIPQEYYINQMDYNAPLGCEGAVGLTGLWIKGYAKEMDYVTFLNQMPYDDYDPNKGFVGSPWTRIPGAVSLILPPAFTEWMNRYGHAADISKCSDEELVRHLLDGNLVIVWVTSGFVNTDVMQESWGAHMDHDHVCILSAYNSETQEFLIVDPYRGYGWKDWATFTNVWHKLRNAAIIY